MSQGGSTQVVAEVEEIGFLFAVVGSNDGGPFATGVLCGQVGFEEVHWWFGQCLEQFFYGARRGKSGKFGKSEDEFRSHLLAPRLFFKSLDPTTTPQHGHLTTTNLYQWKN
jgi:hypothetical protein